MVLTWDADSQLLRRGLTPDDIVVQIHEIVQRDGKFPTASCQDFLPDGTSTYLGPQVRRDGVGGYIVANCDFRGVRTNAVRRFTACRAAVSYFVASEIPHVYDLLLSPASQTPSRIDKLPKDWSSIELRLGSQIWTAVPAPGATEHSFERLFLPAGPGSLRVILKTAEGLQGAYQVVVARS